MTELLIKPVSGACQMRCRYCFYRDEIEVEKVKRPSQMSLETLRTLIKKAFEYEKERLSLAFQGGEPTLRGLDFFKAAVAFTEEYNKSGIPVDFVLQTNGLCLTKEWARFLSENDFLVGVSMDGDEKMHDAVRRGADGSRTYDIVKRSVTLLKSAGVRYNILTVVNRENVRHPAALYAEFGRRGYDNLQFIPCLSPFGKGENLAPSAKEFGAFLSTLFDLWYNDLRCGKSVHIRQFENYTDMLLGGMPEMCGLSGTCTLQTVVETDGSVYPCDFYVKEEYKLGNINETDFADMKESDVARRFLAASLPLPEACRICPVYPICKNGCRRYRGKDGKNSLCEGYRLFFTHALPGFRDIAAHVAEAEKGRNGSI